MRAAVSRRLTPEWAPTARTAGRYWGSAAEGDVPGGDPAGREAAGDAEPAGRDGAGDGARFTSTSAAKRAGPANKATAMENQNLDMGSYATHCGRFRKTNSASPAVKSLPQLA